jgi:cobalamin-dependent methionine synthase I
LLESLGHLSFSHVRNQARKYNLFAVCRLGPGYNHVAMEAQNHLFSLVDSTSIGVFLMNSLTMTPAKSLSFFVVFYKKPNVANTYKCGTCDQRDCPYRI